jgi:hypothetical protein
MEGEAVNGLLVIPDRDGLLNVMGGHRLECVFNMVCIRPDEMA